MQYMLLNIQPIDPIALRIGPFQVHWYGLIIGFGIALGLFLALRESERLGFDKEIITDLVIWAIPFSILGARLYYVIFEWEYYSQYPGDIIKIWNGGLAIHGALIGAILTAIIFTRMKKVSFWKVADIAAPSILLGQAIGRWGNFMNQEAYGGEVSRAFLEKLRLPDFIIDQMFIEGAYHHPTFLYESSWNLIGFFFLLLLRKVNLRRGQIFLIYIIWYSIGRFFIEGMRTDSLMLQNIRIAQLMSLTLIIGAIIILVVRNILGLANKRYRE